MDGQDGRLGNLLVAGGCDEVDAGSPEGTLASDDARFLTHEPGHARHDEEKQDCGADDQHECVRVVDRLRETDAGRDQAGAGEQRQPERRQPGARILRRGLQRLHRRVQRGGTPEQVVEDPARVVDQLVVVGALE